MWPMPPLHSGWVKTDTADAAAIADAARTMPHARRCRWNRPPQSSTNGLCRSVTTDLAVNATLPCNLIQGLLMHSPSLERFLSLRSPAKYRGLPSSVPGGGSDEIDGSLLPQAPEVDTPQAGIWVITSVVCSRAPV